MTSCQAFYCTNEKGKCEKICFAITDQDYCTLVNTSTSDHQKHGKVQTGYDSIGDKKEKCICTYKTS